MAAVMLIESVPPATGRLAKGDLPQVIAAGVGGREEWVIGRNRFERLVGNGQGDFPTKGLGKTSCGTDAISQESSAAFQKRSQVGSLWTVEGKGLAAMHEQHMVLEDLGVDQIELGWRVIDSDA